MERLASWATRAFSNPASSAAAASLGSRHRGRRRASSPLYAAGCHRIRIQSHCQTAGPPSSALRTHGEELATLRVRQQVSELDRHAWLAAHPPFLFPRKKMPPAERTFSPMMGGKLPGGLGNVRAMAPPRHFCGQPTPEGPCDKLGLRRGRCWDHGGGPPRCLHPTPDGPYQKFRQYGGVVLACVEHGGGRRCTYPDCNSNVAKGPLCVTHTNCKTCQADGCETFIQINSVMRQGHSWMCHHPGCKASRASGSFCTRHAGDRVARCRPMSEIRSMWWQMPSARRWSSLSAPDTQWPVSTVHTGRRRGPGLHQARRRPALQVESVRGTHVPVFCQIQTS